MTENLEANANKPIFIAKIAKVVDNGYSLVINKGRDAGVRIGDVFKVYSDEGTLTDPDTHESLGELKIHRGRGRVSQLQDKYAIIDSENYNTDLLDSQRILGQSMALSKLFGQSSKVRTTFNKADIGDIAERA